MSKTMFTITLPKTIVMDDGEIVRMLTDNQWFEWVTKVERQDYGVTITMTDPDGDGEVTNTFSIPDMIKVLKSLPTDKVWAQNVIHDVIEGDLDSETQDLFWQYAMFGDVVYG